MKTTIRRLSVQVCIALMCFGTGAVLRAAETPNATEQDFAPISDAVVRLLKSGDTSAFAKAITPSIEDWRAAASAAGVTQEPRQLPSSDRARAQLESSAKRLLDKAAELKANFSQVRMVAKAAPPKYVGNVRYPGMPSEIPWAEKLDIVLAVEPSPEADGAERLRGEYQIALKGLLRFPSGWRCSESVQWISFPPSVADERTRRELAILEKVGQREPLTLSDDPILSELGESLVRFVRSRDEAAYEKEVMMTLDDLVAWVAKQAAAAGFEAPSRAELEDHWSQRRQTLLASARGFVELADRSGIDLRDAAIRLKGAGFESVYPRGGAGSIDGLEGNDLAVTFSVESDGRAKSGKGLSGEYVLAAKEAMRLNGRWVVTGELRWQRLPGGVLDEKAKAELEFENYVAEHGTLPANSPAPEIEFISVDGEKKGKLSDLQGKVVILDFWATWCGPCQEPMAKMQKYREQNQEWKDRVVVMSLSIDDRLSTVRRHLETRGWTNTFNAWAGEGGWQAAPPKAFRVTGVPTCYVINTDGKIAAAGHPEMLKAPEVVNRLLK